MHQFWSWPNTGKVKYSIFSFSTSVLIYLRFFSMDNRNKLLLCQDKRSSFQIVLLQTRYRVSMHGTGLNYYQSKNVQLIQTECWFQHNFVFTVISLANRFKKIFRKWALPLFHQIHKQLQICFVSNTAILTKFLVIIGRTKYLAPRVACPL